MLLAGTGGTHKAVSGDDSAYLAAMRRLCSSAEQAAGGDPPLPAHFEGLDAYVARRLLRARAFSGRLAAIEPPASDARLHARLAKAAADEVTTLERLTPAVAQHHEAATSTLIGQFQAINTERDRVAAWLGLPDCIRVQGAGPRLAYPRSPARSLARALQGVCADTQARSAYGRQLIGQFDASEHERGRARQRLARALGLRLYGLVHRLSPQRNRLSSIRRLGLRWCSQEPS